MNFIKKIFEFFNKNTILNEYLLDDSITKSRIETQRDKSKKLTDFVTIMNQFILVGAILKVCLKINSNIKIEYSGILYYVYTFSFSTLTLAVCFVYILLWLFLTRTIFYYFVIYFSETKSRTWKKFLLLFCSLNYFAVIFGLWRLSGLMVDTALKAYG